MAFLNGGIQLVAHHALDECGAAIASARQSPFRPPFRPAEAVMAKLTPKWLDVLPDDVTNELSAVVNRITGLPMAQRKKQAKDLGETMVIAHAAVAAEAGAEVVVLIDETAGARIATAEKRRLDRLRTQGRPVKSIIIANTAIVLAMRTC